MNPNGNHVLISTNTYFFQLYYRIQLQEHKVSNANGAPVSQSLLFFFMA
jgi:hypothetical protein